MSQKKIIAAISLLGILLIFILPGCSSCSGKSEAGKDSSSSEDPDDYVRTPQREEPRPDSGPVFIPPDMTIDWRKQLARAQEAFKKFLEKDRHSEKTWIQYLEICEIYSKTDDPKAYSCYDRFFDETQSLNLDDTTMSNAYRWRIVLALRKEDGASAGYYYSKLAPIQERLIKAGLFPKPIQAYATYVHSGVLYYNNDVDGAIRELQRAIDIQLSIPNQNNYDLFDYYERLAMIAREAQKPELALKTLDAWEQGLEASLGKVHLALAYPRLIRINVLLDIGEKEKAGSYWQYILKTLSKTHPKDLTPEEENLYTSTMIRLNMAGVIK